MRYKKVISGWPQDSILLDYSAFVAKGHRVKIVNESKTLALFDGLKSHMGVKEMDCKQIGRTVVEQSIREARGLKTFLGGKTCTITSAARQVDLKS